MTPERLAFMFDPGPETLADFLRTKPSGYGAWKKRSLLKASKTRELAPWEKVLCQLVDAEPIPRYRRVAGSTKMGFCPEWC